MTTRSVLALAVAVLMLAACSGGSGSSSSTQVSDGPGTALPEFPSASVAPPSPSGTATADVRQFLTVVFGDAQRTWRDTFAAAGLDYPPASLRLYTQGVQTACGAQSSEVGPFYCPADHTVYLDVSFFAQLEQQYGVSGDFAEAYVVAHELGHHIQAITGVNARVAAAQQASPASANALSGLAELQADCHAGVWAHSTYRRGLLEPGDLDEALTAAAAVGDDFLQHAATGTTEPESWTHGSSAQRQHWLSVGYDSGKPGSCDTFSS